ncbi:hypothetical protein B0H17DRAFT_1075033, partial [Mycena rosella]
MIRLETCGAFFLLPPLNTPLAELSPALHLAEARPHSFAQVARAAPRSISFQFSSSSLASTCILMYYL